MIALDFNGSDEDIKNIIFDGNEDAFNQYKRDLIAAKKEIEEGNVKRKSDEKKSWKYFLSYIYEKIKPSIQSLANSAKEIIIRGVELYVKRITSNKEYDYSSSYSNTMPKDTMPKGWKSSSYDDDSPW